MPVGPSHNRGRSSGSFSSRSSSSRSSSSSYRSSSSSSYGGHRHYHGHSHTTYYGSSVEIHMSPRGWAIFGLIWGFLLVLILSIIGVHMLSTNLPYRRVMKSDAVQYQEIIDRANAGVEGYYKITIDDIKISGSSTWGDYPSELSLSSKTNRFDADAYSEVVKDGVYYYYLDFSFFDEENGWISGTTYSYYSESAILGMSSLDLIYTKVYDGDGSWDIIQTNYSLDKNIDYWYLGKQVRTAAILLVVAVGMGVLFVWCSTKVHKAKANAKSSTDSSSSATTNETKYKYCRYCGCQVIYSNDRCSACGSREFRDK